MATNGKIKASTTVWEGPDAPWVVAGQITSEYSTVIYQTRNGYTEIAYPWKKEITLTTYTHITVTASTSLYENPSTTARKVSSLTAGMAFNYVETSSDGKFYKGTNSTAQLSGWIPASASNRNTSTKPSTMEMSGGWVLSSRVIIDEDEESTPWTGVIMAKDGANAWKNPSESRRDWITTFPYMGTCTIRGVEGDYYKVDYGDYRGVYVKASAFEVLADHTYTEGSVSSGDVNPSGYGGDYSSYDSGSSGSVQDTAIEYVQKGFTETNPDWTEIFAELEADSNFYNVSYDDEYYQKLSRKYFNTLGYPPKYNMDVDVQYTTQDAGPDGIDITPGIGRVYGKTILSNPPILSICPGKVKMFPNLMGVERDNFIDAMLNISTGNDSLISKIRGDQSSKFSGKLYSFEADVTTYSYYVNALCRACAIIMNLGDELFPNTTSKLKDFDYSYYTIRAQYNSAAAQENDDDGSIFRNFFGGLVKSAGRIFTSLVEDTTYINFFLNGAETTVSETINTETGAGPLDNIFEQVNSIGSTINYFTGFGFNVGSDEASVTEALKSALSTGNSTIDGLVDLGKNFLKGGKVVLPKMISGSTYGKSISCSTKFISPYGDPLSVFIKCVVPTCHLLALALPRQLSDNMYTYPFLIRANQIGRFHVDLGVITNFSLTRGGSDDTSWTIEGLPTEWEVQFEITPLVDELMMSGTKNPVLFCKNENLIDYLGNMCGFDLLANNWNTKAEMTMAFIWNKFTGYPRALENRLVDSLYNRLSGIAKAAWN